MTLILAFSGLNSMIFATGTLYYDVDGNTDSFIEAEQFTTIAGNFREVIDATRSNDKYMDTPNGAGDSTSDYMSYEMDVTNGGTFYVYLLGNGLDGSSDSFYIALNSGTNNSLPTTTGWGWKKSGFTLSIPSGTHTLYIKNREDGTQVDKFMLSKSSSATPTGLGGTALTPQFREGGDTEAPTAPTNLTATAASTSQIDLSWTASTDNVGVTGYDIYRDSTFLTSVTGTSTSDTGLSASTTYSYYVKAKDAAGNVSAASNTASETTQAATSNSKFSIPGSSVTASADDGNVPANTVDGSLSTRWSANGDGQWIQYDLGSNKTAAFVKIAFYQGDTRTNTFDIQTSADGTTWSNALTNTVSSGTTLQLETFDFADSTARYVRYVGHGNSSGNGWNSLTEVEVWGTDSGSSDTEAPTAPTNLTATAVSSSQIDLSWTASTDNVGVTGYDIYRDSTFLTTVTGTSTSDTGLSASTTYIYYVKAKDAAGNVSAASNTANATTQSGGGGGLCATCPPSDNFDLTKWKITLPDASEIQPDQLSSGYTHPDWFYTDSVTGGMVFMSPNIGDTTTNSKYTRSELREMLNPSAGTTSLGNNWVTSTSSTTSKDAAGGVDGTMNATLRVDRVSISGDTSKYGRVVVGQIHGPDTEPIRLYFHKRPEDSKGAIYFGTDDLSNNNTWVDVIGGPSNLNPSNGILLGQKWSYEIKVVGLEMTVKVTPEGGSTTTVNYTLPSGYNDKYLYYKAGVYNQNNTDTTSDSSDHVKATFFNLTHVHP